MGEIKKCLWVIAGTLLMLMSPAGDARSADHYVSPTGNNSTGDGSIGNPWRNIGYAESQAIAGDTIWVMDDDDVATDDYVENVFIDISISVVGLDNDGTRPQIKAANSGDPAVRVHESGVTLRRLDVYGSTGSDEFGIRIDKRDGMSSVVIDNVVVDDCRSGWDAAHTNYHGLYVRYLLNGLITNSTFNNNNSRGILVSNSSSHSPNHQITDNTANANNYYGIELDAANGNTVSGNTLDGNRLAGLRMYNADGNTVKDNMMRGTTQWSGIVLLNNADNNTFTGNTCTGNTEYGVNVYGSVGNLFYWNEFDGLLGSVESAGSAVNGWVSPGPEAYWYRGMAFTAIVGNHYHDYLGSDVDLDGIGDTQHTLPGTEPADTAPLYEGIANYLYGPVILVDGFETGDTTAWSGP